MLFRSDRDAAQEAQLRDRLYQEIGQLKVELDWLKKSMSCSLELRRSWIQPTRQRMSVRRQCALLGLAAASYYYQAIPESAENFLYQRLLDGKCSIKGDELTIRGLVIVQCPDGCVAMDDALSKLSLWLAEQIKSGKVIVGKLAENGATGRY